MRCCYSIIGGRKRVRHWAFFLVAAFCAQPAMAGKPTEARQAADVLFEQGKAAIVGGDWVTGCEKFRQSQEFDPSASTLVKLARCHEHEGKLRAAINDYVQALTLVRRLPENDTHARDLVALVVAAKDQLESRLGTLQIHLSPNLQTFRMDIDGEPVEPQAVALPLRLDPGEHRIAVTAPEHQSAPVQITIAEGERRELTIELAPNPASPTTPSPPVTAVPAPIREVAPAPNHGAAAAPASPAPANSAIRTSQRIVSIASMAAGGILLGVAGYYAIETRRLVQDSRANDDCDSNYDCNSHGLDLLERAGTAQTVAIVLGSAGGLLGGLGVVLWATTPKERAPTTTPRAALGVSPTSVLLRGHW